jgi:histone-lysine N-methyltransferase SETD3
LPETSEVNPSFTWSDAELALLDGSPAIKATRSMQAKLRAEYASLLGGVFKDHPRVFTGTNNLPGDRSLGEEAPGAFCFAHFEWAFTMLFSRAIRLDKLTGGPAVCRKRGPRIVPFRRPCVASLNLPV